MARKIDDQEIENRLHNLGEELRSRFTELEPRLNLHRDRTVRQASLKLNEPQPSRWPKLFIPLTTAAAAAALAIVLARDSSSVNPGEIATPVAVNAPAESDNDYFFANLQPDDSVFAEFSEAESLALESESLEPEFPDYDNEEDPTDDYDNYEAS